MLAPALCTPTSGRVRAGGSEGSSGPRSARAKPPWPPRSGGPVWVAVLRRWRRAEAVLWLHRPPRLDHLRRNVPAPHRTANRHRHRYRRRHRQQRSAAAAVAAAAAATATAKPKVAVLAAQASQPPMTLTRRSRCRRLSVCRWRAQRRHLRRPRKFLALPIEQVCRVPGRTLRWAALPQRDASPAACLLCRRPLARSTWTPIRRWKLCVGNPLRRVQTWALTGMRPIKRLCPCSWICASGAATALHGTSTKLPSSSCRVWRL
mmetsp:Transcript_44561/g.141997  ORF Transcript_44561/g.141997 Transcript_44561/m.141997 type:complete len:262 (-) Transcript_44561:1467-2252(-)